MYFLAVFLHYHRRIAHHGAVVGHILVYHGGSPNLDIVAYPHLAKHHRTRVYAHVVAYGRASVLAVAERNEVQAIEVAAYAVGVEIG